MNVLLVCDFPDPRRDPDFYPDTDLMGMREAVRGLCLACQQQRHQLLITPQPAVSLLVQSLLREEPGLLEAEDDFLRYEDPRRAVFIGGMEAEIKTFHRLRAAGIPCLPVASTGLAPARMLKSAAGEFHSTVRELLHKPYVYPVLFEALLSR